MNIQIRTVLNSDFIGLETVVVVLTRNKSTIALVKDKNQTTYLFLTQSQFHL